MEDDIDEKHNLKTRDLYLKAMRTAGNYEGSPCLECEGVCFRDDMLQCDRWIEWRHRVFRDG